MGLTFDTGEIAVLKQKARNDALKRRDAVSAGERARKSAAICDDVFDFLSGSTFPRTGAYLAVYYPMRSEVDLLPLVRKAQESGWNVCFPVMVRENAQDDAVMRFVDVNPLSDGSEDVLTMPAFFSHPARPISPDDTSLIGLRFVNPSEIGAVAVPLVAFDSHNNRLGYGGGNYDRFLPLLNPETLIFGVAFDEQRLPLVPTDSHDLPLPHIFHV